MLYHSAQIREINLWWDARIDFKKGYRYLLDLNGVVVGKTSKIFFDFLNLQPDTEYVLGFSLVNRLGEVVGERETVKVKTLPPPKTIDISKAPYFAKGDGKTDNTEIVNRAISENMDGTVIFFPKGVYLVDEIRLDGSCILDFELNAFVRLKDGKSND